MTDVQQAVPVAQVTPDEVRIMCEKLREIAGLGESNMKRCATPIRDWSAEAATMIERLALPCKSGEGAEASVTDGWTLEQGRPAATAPYACHVLGGRLDETAGEWVMAVVSTPLATPFTHWWPLPGASTTPDATQTREAEGDYHGARHLLLNLLATIHRDGGQYVDAHGEFKAAEDAVQIVASLLAFTEQVADLAGDALDAHASPELRDLARAALNARDAA